MAKVEIEIPVKMTVSTETARVCHSLLDAYYDTDVRAVNLKDLAVRLSNIQRRHEENILDFKDKGDLEWLIGEMEQVCLIPFDEGGE